MILLFFLALFTTLIYLSMCIESKNIGGIKREEREEKDSNSTEVSK
jgi:hypothetical protein